jgi:predicted SnoaL-like aldol condensation-catalyzing enzyme
MQHNPERNKQNAIAFYRMAYEGESHRAVEQFVGDTYIQHNPAVGDGPEPFIAYFDEMREQYPEKSIEFVRAVSEGNQVALHTHQTWGGRSM